MAFEYGGRMNLYRHIIVIVQIFAFTFYPQMVTATPTAALFGDVPNVVITHSGHHALQHRRYDAGDVNAKSMASKTYRTGNHTSSGSSHPVPVKDDPCCSLSGGICVTMISGEHAILQPSNGRHFDFATSTPLAEIDPALLPPPPKTSDNAGSTG